MGRHGGQDSVRENTVMEVQIRTLLGFKDRGFWGLAWTPQKVYVTHTE